MAFIKFIINYKVKYLSITCIKITTFLWNQWTKVYIIKFQDSLPNSIKKLIPYTTYQFSPSKLMRP